LISPGKTDGNIQEVLTMQNFNYTQAEAEALVGNRFETLVEWDRVTKGTRGRVIWSSGSTVWASPDPYEKYEVVIAWDRPLKDTGVGELPLEGRFSKFQMQKYMRKMKS
jgi:hypothetical protein